MTKRVVRNVIIAGIALALLSIGLLLGMGLEKGRYAWDRMAWSIERSVMKAEILDWRGLFGKMEKK